MTVVRDKNYISVQLGQAQGLVPFQDVCMHGGVKPFRLLTATYILGSSKCITCILCIPKTNLKLSFSMAVVLPIVNNKCTMILLKMWIFNKMAQTIMVDNSWICAACILSLQLPEHANRGLSGLTGRKFCAEPS